MVIVVTPLIDYAGECPPERGKSNHPTLGGGMHVSRLGIEILL